MSFRSRAASVKSTRRVLNLISPGSLYPFYFSHWEALKKSPPYFEAFTINDNCLAVGILWSSCPGCYRSSQSLPWPCLNGLPLSSCISSRIAPDANAPPAPSPWPIPPQTRTDCLRARQKPPLESYYLLAVILAVEGEIGELRGMEEEGMIRRG